MVKIIAIDGPASVGKSTLAKKISKTFKSPVLYSGKLYRALALIIIKRNISFNNTEAILKCIKYIDLDNLSSAELYSSQVDNISSIISAKKQVRNKLVTLQRSFPKKYGSGKKFAIIEQALPSGISFTSITTHCLLTVAAFAEIVLYTKEFK